MKLKINIENNSQIIFLTVTNNHLRCFFTCTVSVQKQSTKEGKEKLVKKYDAEFAKKQEAIKKNYAGKLQAIDKSISATIAAEAKAKSYNLVLSKGVVLYGGEDITASISKIVK